MHRRDILIMLLCAPSLPFAEQMADEIEKIQKGEKFWIKRSMDKLEGLSLYYNGEHVDYTVEEIWEELQKKD